MKYGRIGKDSSKNIGNFYEGMAADYLEKQGFTGIQRTRGDGDCFYRCMFYIFISTIEESLTNQFSESVWLCMA